MPLAFNFRGQNCLCMQLDRCTTIPGDRRDNQPRIALSPPHTITAANDLDSSRPAKHIINGFGTRPIYKANTSIKWIMVVGVPGYYDNKVEEKFRERRRGLARAQHYDGRRPEACPNQKPWSHLICRAAKHILHYIQGQPLGDRNPWQSPPHTSHNREE